MPDMLFNTFEYLPHAYFAINQQYEVLFWNVSMEKILKISKAEIVGKRLYDIFPAFTEIIYQKEIEKVFSESSQIVLSANSCQKLYASFTTQSCPVFKSIVTKFPLPHGGVAALFTVDDCSEMNEFVSVKRKLVDEITEKEKIYQMLEEQHENIEEAFLSLSDKNIEVEVQKQQLQELNATKDRLFSIIAHDLINPFNSMLGISVLMAERFDDFTVSEIKEFAGLLNSTINQTYSLLENLLQWSRSQTGRIVFSPLIIEIDKLIDSNIELHQMRAQKKNINLLSKNGHVRLNADPDMVNIVLRNLISNAIKFTPEKGTIEVFTEKESESDGFVKVSVKDSGVGISPDNLEKLFRVDESLTTPGTANEKGTGLGLLLCKEFVEMNGGTIWVESQEGVGSIFNFTLPVA